MKKLIYPLAALLMAATFSSCEDFLDKTPYDRVDPQADVTDQVAVAMANACYIPLRSSNLYNQRIWSLDIVAGNSNVGAGGGDDGIETIQAANFTTLSDNAMALYMWRSPWIGIAQCNNLINALENSNNVSDEIRDRSMGEALFLRAHYYYLLARLYGGVPLRLEPYDPDTSSAIARTSLDETYRQIIEDCTGAISLLPPKYEYDNEQKGRACQEAALYMLADIYLTLAPSNPSLYNEVIDLCDEITSLGYDLSQCPYADNFNCPVRNGAESIFEVQYSGSTESDFWGNTPYVLLMQAEAFNELGQTSNARGPVNIVRKRAGLSPLPSNITKTDMREAIIHERRMELAFEGHRWFDLIRIDNGDYAVRFLHSIGKTNATKDRLLFPIPQTEIDANPLMTQNPGY